MTLLSCDKKKESHLDTEETGFFGNLFASNNPEIDNLELNPVDYISWCENKDHGLIKTKEIGDFRFSAFYKPLNYLALLELNQNDTINSVEFKNKLDEYGDLTYFSFKIENTKQQTELLKVNLQNEAEYYGRLEYLSFKMQDDFKLLKGKDTLNCSLYHFERVYGLAPYATFVLGFDAKLNKNEDLTLCYHDKIFKTGIILLNFNKNTISHLPKLKI